MRAFINNLSSDVRYLNKSAKYTANVIQKVANENKQVSFALVTQLLGKHGHQHFDRITKTKTVENLLATMDAEGVRSYLEYLARVFVQHEENDKVDSVRSWALRQMTLLVKNTRVPKEEEWLADFVRFLMVYAFFDVKKGATRGSWFEVDILNLYFRYKILITFSSLIANLHPCSRMPFVRNARILSNLCLSPFPTCHHWPRLRNSKMAPCSNRANSMVYATTVNSGCTMSCRFIKSWPVTKAW